MTDTNKGLSTVELNTIKADPIAAIREFYGDEGTNYINTLRSYGLSDEQILVDYQEYVQDQPTENLFRMALVSRTATYAVGE